MHKCVKRINKSEWYVFPVTKMIVITNEFSTKTETGKSRTGISNNKEKVQPKCCIEVCRTMCPYGRMNLVGDVVGLNEKRDAVTFARTNGGKRSDWKACMIMYLNRKCRSEEFDGREMEFVKEHTPRLMEECPIRMEHEIYAWNKKKKN